MNTIGTKSLRPSISEFVNPSNKTALVIFLIDMTIYVSAVAGIIFFESLVLKALCSILCGLKMASLFVIAHDAAHDNYTKSKWLNKVIARLAFLPCYHNYSLWLIVHNRLHHQLTNIKGVNSWSPLSKQDFDNLPKYRQLLEKFYRSPFGISFNYMIERWLKDKFFPFVRLTKGKNGAHWLDFTMVSGFLFSQIMFFTYLGFVSPEIGVFGSLLLGVVAPFMVFCYMVGFSVYQQHTHEMVPWFTTLEERDACCDVEDLTIHVKYPKWYNLISHNVMEHTAHHVDPRIPSYELSKAQSVLLKVLGDDILSINFSFSDFIKTMQLCKLYDYDTHCWLDFDGNVTNPTVLAFIKDKDHSVNGSRTVDEFPNAA